MQSLRVRPPVCVAPRYRRSPKTRPFSLPDRAGILLDFAVVGRSGECRFGQRVIGSKAGVTWHYETVLITRWRALQRVIRTAMLFGIGATAFLTVS